MVGTRLNISHEEDNCLELVNTFSRLKATILDYPAIDIIIDIDIDIYDDYIREAEEFLSTEMKYIPGAYDEEVKDLSPVLYHTYWIDPSWDNDLRRSYFIILPRITYFHILFAEDVANAKEGSC